MIAHVMLVAGARPNFVKVAPLARELGRSPRSFTSTLIHTGQHYDAVMSATFFDELGIATPDVNLEVGSGSHSAQTSAIMSRFEPVLLHYRPDMVLVVGDVNSALACALVAAKLDIEVGHVEAGLRSFDRTMPEEINRVLTDHLASLLFVTEKAGEENLLREGIAPPAIHLVGNVMIDTLLANRARARARFDPCRFGLDGQPYAVLTLHRPSNVDRPEVFNRVMTAVAAIAEEVPVLFPVHPRTSRVLAELRVARHAVESGRLRMVEPLGYLDFLSLLDRALVVLTDSGGIQEETTVLGVPCLTLRDNTERPVTITSGTNRLVGTDPNAILDGWRAVCEHRPVSRIPDLWDGRAAERICAVLRAHFGIRESTPQ